MNSEIVGRLARSFEREDLGDELRAVAQAINGDNVRAARIVDAARRFRDLDSATAWNDLRQVLDDYDRGR